MKTLRGLHHKYQVVRTDGRSAAGEKHHDCEYFVLDVTHDPHAKAALLAYAESCKSEYPALAHDIRHFAIFVTPDSADTAGGKGDV